MVEVVAAVARKLEQAEVKDAATVDRVGEVLQDAVGN